MRRPLRRLAFGLVAAACAAPGSPRAQELVADLSRHLVAITTGFVGTDVLLFGATDGEGDVIVVVRGPRRPTVVRHRTRMAGIWVNDAELTFVNAPAFYWMASSRPLDRVLPAVAMERHRIGIRHLALRPDRAVDEDTLESFRDALVRNKTRIGLYGEQLGSIAFLGNRLFRTTVYFPANVPTGTYTVAVFLVRQGRVVSAQTTPLLVSKVGLGAEISRFAHERSILYGIMAIAMALLAGWLAGAVFRKA
ncbi:MAG TPA: TIGR02186 family protein [Alphaproteobacteria bacterium]|jgi:uncharacterized protein (TIGR02186 family)